MEKVCNNDETSMMKNTLRRFQQQLNTDISQLMISFICEDCGKQKTMRLSDCTYFDENTPNGVFK